MISSIKQIIPNTLYQGPRPGYYQKKSFNSFLKCDVEHDILHIKENFKSVLCLMTNKEIKKHYCFDLLNEYKRHGLNVVQYPVNDNSFMTNTGNKDRYFDYNKIFSLFDEMPKPVYLHCSAGVMRSKYLGEKLYDNYFKQYNLW